MSSLECVVPWTLGAVKAPPETQVQGVSPWDEGSLLDSGCGGFSPRHPGSRGVPTGVWKVPWTLAVCQLPPTPKFKGCPSWRVNVPSNLGVVAAPPDTHVHGVSSLEGRVLWTLGAVAAPPTPRFERCPPWRKCPLDTGCGGTSPTYPGSSGVPLKWVVPSTLGAVVAPPTPRFEGYPLEWGSP